MPQDKEESGKFAVSAEVEGYKLPLIMTDLTFPRLMDDVVVPYKTNEPFFIDGIPVRKQELRKLKITRQHDSFAQAFHNLHWDLRGADLDKQKLYGKQCYVRLEALLRESGEDVMSQVIKAFEKIIRPRIKEYVAKRAELINGAFEAFSESIRMPTG